jgi:hypothetical protein
MNKLLALVPWWIDAILAAVIVAALALAVHGYNRHQQGIGAARVQALWDAERAQAQGAVIKAQADNTSETQRRIDDQAKVIHEQAQNLAQALSDNDALRSAGPGLRAAQARYADARCRASASNPAPVGASAPADPAPDLLADVQRRLDEATDGVGRFADQSHIAGTTCERSYQALTPLQ